MMKLSEVIRKIDPDLAPLGFLRKNATWNRTESEFIDTINIQISNHSKSITLNAGVISRRTHSLIWGKEPDVFVDEASCAVRARIGDLRDGLDKWWDLDEINLVEEISGSIRHSIIPFLAQMHSLREMQTWLERPRLALSKFPLTRISCATLRYQQGDLAGARDMLAEIEKNALGDWRLKAREVIGRIERSIN